LKYVFLFLLLINKCYGTDLECTCAISSKIFCPACEENLSFYSLDPKNKNKDDENVELCKHCEENLISSETFYSFDQNCTNKDDQNVALCEKYEENAISPETFDSSFDQKDMNKYNENVGQYGENSIDSETFYFFDQKTTNKDNENAAFYEKYVENLISPEIFSSLDQKNMNKDDENVEICEKYKENSINPEIFFSFDQKDMNKDYENAKLCEQYEENSIDPESFYFLDQKSTNKDDENAQLCETYEENLINPEIFDSLDQKSLNKDDENIELCEKYGENSISRKTFCASREQNLYLSSAHNDDESVEFCERCDETSKHFFDVMMNMETKQFCARCSLEYLCYYFPRQTIENTKFYCVQIIFNLIGDNTVQKTTKFAINELVNDKFNKQLKILEKRRKQNASYNLFVMTNEILSAFKQKTLTRRTCGYINCMETTFHLLKVPCCQNFICFTCIISGTILGPNCNPPKCMMCESTYICHNMQDFEKIFKSFFFGFEEQAKEFITKETQREMENALFKIKKSKKNRSMQYAQFSALTKKWLAPVVMMASSTPNLFSENFEEKIQNMMKHTFTDQIILTFTTIVPQMFIFVNIAKVNQVFNGLWFGFNVLFVSFLQISFRAGTKIFQKNEKGERIFNLSTETTISWLNVLFCYLVFGPNFHENFSLLLWNFIFIPLIIWPSSMVSKYLKNSLDENSYEFY